MKEKIKAKVKAKTKPIKQKVKAKVKPTVAKKKCKGGACSYVGAIAIAFMMTMFAGCLTPGQASRGTSNNEGDVEPTVKICIGDNSHSNTVIVTQRITHGDGAIASADSSGSSETQTQTPTFDISPKTDVRYNDALAAASTGSKSVIDGLSDVSKNAVLAIMAAKGNGSVSVTKADGSEGTVKCADGQCSFVE